MEDDANLAINLHQGALRRLHSIASNNDMTLEELVNGLLLAAVIELDEQEAE